MANELGSQNQDRGYLLTEQANPHSQNLDRLSALEIVELFNREDAKAVAAVGQEKEAIGAAITVIAAAIANEYSQNTIVFYC